MPANTVLMKDFPGGLLVVMGANSGAGLRSMPMRVMLQDEIDAFPDSVDDEGDPCVLADKRINSRKGNKMPDEAGLKLLRMPKAPREMPVSQLIKNQHEVREWDMFLAGGGGVVEF